MAKSVDIQVSGDGAIPHVVDHLFRLQAGRVVSTLTRIFGPGHLQLAEDVVQETMIKALRAWTYHGVPANPTGWIMQVARNAALDALRRDRTLRDRQEQIARGLSESTPEDPGSAAMLDHELRDDQLRMIFLCCHPVLSTDAQITLTLKTVGGFTASEIARAFVTSEATIAQRLVRAKRTIRAQKLPFDLPGAESLLSRLDSVLAVLYALFNEGYNAFQGQGLIRHELCAEGIRLVVLLAEHPVGDQPKVQALLALMLLHASRLPARAGPDSRLLLLDEQDRSQWDRGMISAGMSMLERASRGTELSQYHLEAAIAACYAMATSYESTPWDRILFSYDLLVAERPSSVSRLNRAVTIAMVHGNQAGLTDLTDVGRLPGMNEYYLFLATRADLQRRAGE